MQFIYRLKLKQACLTQQNILNDLHILIEFKSLRDHRHNDIFFSNNFNIKVLNQSTLQSVAIAHNSSLQWWFQRGNTATQPKLTWLQVQPCLNDVMVPQQICPFLLWFLSFTADSEWSLPDWILVWFFFSFPACVMSLPLHSRAAHKMLIICD